MPKSEDEKKAELEAAVQRATNFEDDALSHDVPTDLMVLHEVLEWEAATK